MINRFFALLIPFFILSGIIFLWFNNPINTTGSSFYPKCPTYIFFDIHCVFCGATRCIYSVLHFDFLSAFRQNAFLILISPLLIYESLGFYFKSFFDVELKAIHYSNLFWIIIFILGFLFMILRNIDSFPFNYFAPFV